MVSPIDQQQPGGVTRLAETLPRAGEIVIAHFSVEDTSYHAAAPSREIAPGRKNGNADGTLFASCQLTGETNG